MKSNPRTYKVQAYKELNNVTESDMVSWAVSMIENGFNGKYLMQLASFTPPYNYFEVINLLEKTLKELCIPLIIGKEAILKYTSDIIDDLIDGLKEYNEVMHELSGLCINNDYMKELYDFYLLDCAIDDLKYGENQFHWPDLSLNKLNIESTVIEVCRKWKQNFDSSYKK